MTISAIRRLAVAALCAATPLLSQSAPLRYISARVWPKNQYTVKGYVVSPIQESVFKKKGAVTEIQFLRSDVYEWVTFDVSKIDRIEYELSAAPLPCVLPTEATKPAPAATSAGLKGRWTGTYKNTLGDSGATTLVFSTDQPPISGNWDGDPFTNGAWNGNVLRWSYYSPTNKVTYTCEFQFTSPSTARVTYTATGAKSYSGVVENYTRQ